MKPRGVLEATADTFGVAVADLTGPSRAQSIVAARQAAMLILRDHIPWLSCEEIGRLLRRDHSTVLYGVQAARERGRTEAPYQQAILAALNAARTQEARQ